MEWKNQNSILKKADKEYRERWEHTGFTLPTDKDTFYVFGGSNEMSYFSSILKCTKTESEEWKVDLQSTSGKEPTPRESHKMAYAPPKTNRYGILEYNEKENTLLCQHELYMFGGSDNKHYLNDIWKLTIRRKLKQIDTTKNLASNYKKEGSESFIGEKSTGTPPGTTNYITQENGEVTATTNIQIPKQKQRTFINNNTRIDIGNFKIIEDDWMWKLLDIGSKKKDIPEGRCNHSMNYANGLLWVFGGKGKNGKVFEDFWTYDIEDNVWGKVRSEGSSPSRRYGHGSFIYDAHWEEHEKDILKKKSSNLNILSAPKPYLTSQDTLISGDSQNLRMIVSFGFDNKMGILKTYLFFGQYRSDVWEFNFETLKWKKLNYEGTPKSKYGHATIPIGNGCAFQFGGQHLGKYSKNAYIIDMYNKKWVKVQRNKLLNNSWPHARRSHVLINTNDDLIVHGGGSNMRGYFESVCVLPLTSLFHVYRVGYHQGGHQSTDEVFNNLKPIHIDKITAESIYLKTHPNDHEAYKRRAKAYLESRVYQKAFDDIEKAIELDKTEEKMIIKAKILIALNQPQQAKEILESIQKTNDNIDEINLGLMTIYRCTHRYDLATKYAKDLLQKYEICDNEEQAILKMEILKQYIYVLTETNQFNECEPRLMSLRGLMRSFKMSNRDQTMKKITSRVDDHKELYNQCKKYFEEAKVKFNEKSYLDAKKLFLDSVEIMPQFYEALPYLYKIEMSNHNILEAKRLAKQYMYLRPDIIESYLLLAGCSVEQRSITTALTILNQAKRLPDLPADSQKEIDDQIKKTYEIDDKCRDAIQFANEAEHFIQEKKLEQALESINKAIDKDPKYVIYRKTRTSLYRMLNKINEAKTEGNYCITHYPYSDVGYLESANTYIAMNSYVEAREVVRKGIKNVSDTSELQNMLDHILHLEQAFNNALLSFKRAQIVLSTLKHPLLVDRLKHTQVFTEEDGECDQELIEPLNSAIKYIEQANNDMDGMMLSFYSSLLTLYYEKRDFSKTISVSVRVLLDYSIQNDRKNMVHHEQNESTHLLAIISLSIRAYLSLYMISQAKNMLGQYSMYLDEKDKQELTEITDSFESKWKEHHENFAVGTLKYMEANYTEALPILHKACETKRSGEALFFLSSCLFQLKRYDESREAIEKALNIRKLPHYFHLHARTYIEQADFDKALEICKGALDNYHPTSRLLNALIVHIYESHAVVAANIISDLAIEKYKQYDETGALDGLNEAITKVPSLTEARILRAEILYRQKKLTGSLNDVDYLIDHQFHKIPDTTQLRIYKLKIQILLQLHRIEQARSILDRSLLLKIKDQALEELQEHIIAREKQQQAGKQHGDQGMEILAQTVTTKEDILEAIKLFSKALYEDPKNVLYYVKRCYCYLKVNQFESALHDSQIATNYDPVSINGYTLQSESFMYLKKFKEARDILDSFIQICQSNNSKPQPHETILIQQKKDDIEQVENKIKMAEENYAKYQEAYKEKDQGKMRKHIDLCLEYDPFNPEYIDEKISLEAQENVSEALKSSLTLVTDYPHNLNYQLKHAMLHIHNNHHLESLLTIINIIDIIRDIENGTKEDFVMIEGYIKVNVAELLKKSSSLPALPDDITFKPVIPKPKEQQIETDQGTVTVKSLKDFLGEDFEVDLFSDTESDLESDTTSVSASTPSTTKTISKKSTKSSSRSLFSLFSSNPAKKKDSEKETAFEYAVYGVMAFSKNEEEYNRLYDRLSKSFKIEKKYTYNEKTVTKFASIIHKDLLGMVLNHPFYTSKNEKVLNGKIKTHVEESAFLLSERFKLDVSRSKSKPVESEVHIVNLRIIMHSLLQNWYTDDSGLDRDIIKILQYVTDAYGYDMVHTHILLFQECMNYFSKSKNAIENIYRIFLSMIMTLCENRFHYDEKNNSFFLFSQTEKELFFGQRLNILINFLNSVFRDHFRAASDSEELLVKLSFEVFSLLELIKLTTGNADRSPTTPFPVHFVTENLAPSVKTMIDDISSVTRLEQGTVEWLEFTCDNLKKQLEIYNNHYERLFPNTLSVMKTAAKAAFNNIYSHAGQMKEKTLRVFEIPSIIQDFYRFCSEYNSIIPHPEWEELFIINAIQWVTQQRTQFQETILSLLASDKWGSSNDDGSSDSIVLLYRTIVQYLSFLEKQISSILEVHQESSASTEYLESNIEMLRFEFVSCSMKATEFYCNLLYEEFKKQISIAKGKKEAFTSVSCVILNNLRRANIEINGFPSHLKVYYDAENNSGNLIQDQIKSSSRYVEKILSQCLDQLSETIILPIKDKFLLMMKSTTVEERMTEEIEEILNGLNAILEGILDNSLHDQIFQHALYLLLKRVDMMIKEYIFPGEKGKIPPYGHLLLLQSYLFPSLINFFVADGNGLPKEDVDRIFDMLRKLISYTVRSIHELLSLLSKIKYSVSEPDVPLMYPYVLGILENRAKNGDKSASNFIQAERKLSTVSQESTGIRTQILNNDLDEMKEEIAVLRYENQEFAKELTSIFNEKSGLDEAIQLNSQLSIKRRYIRDMKKHQREQKAESEANSKTHLRLRKVLDGEFSFLWTEYFVNKKHALQERDDVLVYIPCLYQLVPGHIALYKDRSLVKFYKFGDSSSSFYIKPKHISRVITNHLSSSGYSLKAYNQKKKFIYDFMFKNQFDMDRVESHLKERQHSTKYSANPKNLFKKLAPSQIPLITPLLDHANPLNLLPHRPRLNLIRDDTSASTTTTKSRPSRHRRTASTPSYRKSNSSATSEVDWDTFKFSDSADEDDGSDSDDVATPAPSTSAAKSNPSSSKPSKPSKSEIAILNADFHAPSFDDVEFFESNSIKASKQLQRVFDLNSSTLFIDRFACQNQATSLNGLLYLFSTGIGFNPNHIHSSSNISALNADSAAIFIPFIKIMKIQKLDSAVRVAFSSQQVKITCNSGKTYSILIPDRDSFFSQVQHVVKTYYKSTIKPELLKNETILALNSKIKSKKFYMDQPIGLAF